MTSRAVIRGIGSYLPACVMENAEFASRLGLETSDEWIRERTGIKRRHIAADGETTSDLGFAAAQKALAHANMDISEIDLIMVATSTPDLTFPSTATMIQHRLGMTHGAAFDIQAVCSGFLYGIHTANALIRSGAHQRILLIGAETFSRILDWEDRGTCVLFGDGAGAIILEGQNDTEDGIIHSIIRSNGAHKDMLYVDGGPSSTGTVGKLRMLGNAVFKHAVTDIAGIIRTCAEEANYDVPTIDWFVPHQANQRILTAVARKLKLQPEQVISTVDEHANTSAASVPLAWDAAVRDGRIKRGDTIMLEAFGGGFTWGACLLRY
ncbi:3-oxoacyl-[acyl-carrier-protein] synthase 3 [Algimonas arctica]|uniref:Beta-ketoacyl-[acyl-carrier-protein] synthase III n=1 Tax=Algimonas arctica TaxID=1479486 RepID=A0A8J3G0W5_9PROT|nr:beta-ketoacyl-ACP synthase III [Algimonas arctica]GHA83804.1 3-oxoacyl-[acyl-carrier-protein] synthase 3 [Algimonas arctica]